MYLDTFYQLMVDFRAIARERQAEADAWRLAHEAKAHGQRASRRLTARPRRVLTLQFDQRFARSQTETDTQVRAFAASRI